MICAFLIEKPENGFFKLLIICFTYLNSSLNSRLTTGRRTYVLLFVVILVFLNRLKQF